MHNPFGDEIRRPTAWLGNLVWDCIKDTVSGAVEIMDWLKECVTISIKHGVPLRWVTTDGFLVKQAYESLDRFTVKTCIGQVTRQQRLRAETGELSFDEMSMELQQIGPTLGMARSIGPRFGMHITTE